MLKQLTKDLLKCYGLPLMALMVLINSLFGAPSIALAQDLASEYPDWEITFNPTGTHLHKDRLLIRLDIYPPFDSQTFDEQYAYVVDESSPEFLAGYPGEVDKFGRPVDYEAYQAWLDFLPHVWRLNPAICVFVQINTDTTKDDLLNFTSDTYTPDVLATMDSALIQENSIDLISPYMKGKTILSHDSVDAARAPPDLIDTINDRFSDSQYAISGNGEVSEIEPQSITIGNEASDRGAMIGSYTIVDHESAADGTGTIDTWETWFGQDGTGFEVATFYVVSGNNLSTRDYEEIGSVSSGSKQTFSGLSTDVETGDWAGFWADTGQMDADNAGSIWYQSNDLIPTTNTTFNPYSNYTLSLKGTGTEGGAAPTVTYVSTTNIGTTTATVTGNVTVSADNVTYRGFEYDEDGTPYDNSQGDSGNFTIGTFSENLTGLSKGTKVHIIATANNSGGKGDSSEATFITLPDSPTGATVNATTNSTIQLYWDGAVGATKYMVRYATGGTPPSDNTSGTQGYYNSDNWCTISGLPAGTQISTSVFSIAIDDGLSSCSANYSSATDYTNPGEVYNVSTGNETATSFSANWTKGLNSENTTMRYKTGSYPTGPSDGSSGYSGTGNTTTVSGLSDNTTYYGIFWAYDTDSGYYSDNGTSFIITTSANVTISAPTVTTSDASNVEETTATVGGEITDAGGENCTRRIYYDTDLAAPWSDNWTDAGTHAEGSFSTGLTSLNKGDKYGFMASANNTAGTGNGTIKYFMTKPDEPTGGSATGGTANISLSWTKGDGADNTYVYGKQGSYPTAVGDGTLVYSSSDNSTVHSGLGDNETWYYRAWSQATDNGTTKYSDTYTQMTATTDIVTPTVQTNAASNIGPTYARLNGEVTDNGGENPDMWIFWGQTDQSDNASAWSNNVSMGAQGSTFYTDLTSLSENTTYFYNVGGYNSEGTWAWGSSANFTTTVYTPPAEAPEGIPGVAEPEVTAIEWPQLIQIFTLLFLAFWQGKDREGILLYAMTGIATIAFGLSWNGAYETPESLVFTIAMLGVGLYCLTLAAYNAIMKLKG